jgi:hypothetical protein
MLEGKWTWMDDKGGLRSTSYNDLGLGIIFISQIIQITCLTRTMG